MDMVPIGSPQPEYKVPTPSTIPDNDEDQPVPGQAIIESGSYHLPPLIYGAATLSRHYNDDSTLDSSTPFRAVRLALRYGINAFDTSPYYGASEIILGQILLALRDQFPRSSYTLITKCGRYGARDFDYSPNTIRQSVLRSLARFGTDYLDVVYLHDIEFVSTIVRPQQGAGKHAEPLTNENLATEWGIAEGQEGKIWGPGDQTVLDALAELRKMKDEGLIKAVGISGYLLPTLLRLSLMFLKKTGKPIDILLSFSHYDIQNSAFAAYYPVLTGRAQIERVLTASPFSMGLLTPNPPPWHPAPPDLTASVNRVKAWTTNPNGWPDGIANLALGWAMRREGAVMGAEGKDVPIVIGWSTPKEIHESVAVWREVVAVQAGTADERARKRKQAEQTARDMFTADGWADCSWDHLT
ncbi:hypothetical protein FRB95_013832 [Tulasnella sp. JGI-2019a]|nr:hypothetical protein FRB95_013832 [Tulasnella sp. JGI-2019a]